MDNNNYSKNQINNHFLTSVAASYGFLPYPMDAQGQMIIGCGPYYSLNGNQAFFSPDGNYIGHAVESRGEVEFRTFYVGVGNLKEVTAYPATTPGVVEMDPVSTYREQYFPPTDEPKIDPLNDNTGLIESNCSYVGHLPLSDETKIDPLNTGLVESNCLYVGQQDLPLSEEVNHDSFEANPCPLELNTLCAPAYFDVPLSDPVKIDPLEANTGQQELSTPGSDDYRVLWNESIMDACPVAMPPYSINPHVPQDLQPEETESPTPFQNHIIDHIIDFTTEEEIGDEDDDRKLKRRLCQCDLTTHWQKVHPFNHRTS